MSKKIKIKIKNLENLEFEILEKAEIGDYIILSEIKELGESQIYKSANIITEQLKNDWLNEFKNSDAYTKIINENNYYKNKAELLNKDLVIQKKEFESQKKDIENNAINKFKENEHKNVLNEKHNLSIKITELSSQLAQNEATVIAKFKESEEFKQLNEENKRLIKETFNHKAEIIKTEKTAIEKFKESEEFIKLNEENKKLNEENKKLIAQASNFKAEIINTEKIAVEKFRESQEFKNLKSENTNFLIKNNELELKLKRNDELVSEKIKNAKTEAIDDFKKSEEYEKINSEIEELKAEINRLNRGKSSNSKVLGENFEKWIDGEFQDAFNFIENVKWTNQPRTKSNTKSDFLFEILTNETQEKVASVVIEAKTAGDNSNQKNESFLHKLEKERKELNANYGLLITELEWDDNFIIKRGKKDKKNDFSNIFITRPGYFTIFLKLFYNIFNTNKDLIGLNWKFEDKEKIDLEFNNLKNEILDNSLKHVENSLSSILEEIEKVEKSSSKMKEIIRKTLDRHIATIKNKIDSFKIKKIIKQIEKYDEKYHHFDKYKSENFAINTEVEASDLKIEDDKLNNNE
ncbi:DUF2130 domain-containing protein [[Mycoplasma] collis]|uniref:DUF2130 domain-containing protein n=1 Tax=[Mycoplasma] collis TaxID=2127 RepID=UPI00051B7949|nr:DUF2130 domain-containing protein [[Mycoplasma] collis]